MNLEMRSADFRRAILTANRVVERRNTIPILSTVRCIANGSFEATATDLDMSIVVSVPREAGSHVEFALMAPREVVSALTAAGSDVARLSHADGKVTLSSGELSLQSGALPVEDFPAQVDRAPSEEFAVTLSKDNMASISRVADAMSAEETRYYLNGINMLWRSDAGFGGLRFQATDGHRLYFADVPCPDVTGTLPGDIIIPRKMILLLLDLARGAEDGVRLSYGRVAAPNAPEPGTTAPAAGGPRVAFSFTTSGMRVTLIAKPIDGTFPDVNRVIPAPGGVQMLWKTADLKRALGAVSGLSRETRSVRIELNDSGAATISAAFLDIALSTSVRVACEHKKPGFVIGYNGKYLRSIIAAASGDEVLIDVVDASSPGLVRNPADDAWTGVLMPMRV